MPKEINGPKAPLPDAITIMDPKEDNAMVMAGVPSTESFAQRVPPKVEAATQQQQQ